MIDWRLRRQLDKAARRLNVVRMLRRAILMWLALALLSGVLWLACYASGLAWPIPRIVLSTTIPVVVLLAAMVAIIAPHVWLPNYRYVARRVESTYPELQTCLLAAIDAEPTLPGARLGYLQDRVVAQALAHGYRHGWQHVATRWNLLGWHVGHAVAVFVFLFALTEAASIPAGSRPWIQSSPAIALAAADQAFEATIEPGNTEVERGTSLLVMARFRGAVPRKVTLNFEPEKNGPEPQTAKTPAAESSPAKTPERPVPGRIEMSKALQDPLFGGSIASVTEPITYHVEYGGQRSETYRIAVFEFPRLVRADATLIFPTYTTLPEKQIQDVRRVSAVVGTRIRLNCGLNKAVATAALVEKDGRTIDLHAASEGSLVYTTEFVLEHTMRCELKLADAQGRANKELADFVFTALPNNPPDVKLAAPARDVEASPLEELDLKANAFDDYGLERVGVTYTFAGKPEKDLVLANRVAGKQRVDVGQLVSLEQLAAEPDQLLSYYFWAEDIGPDGQIRHVSSDMYFAEVRPFEEIFRQGQQPGSGEQMQMQGQGSQNANEAENLSQLQKEIINATWKLVRRETSDQPTKTFGTDVTLVHESQQTVFDRVNELAQKVEDPQSLRYVQDVLKNVGAAMTQLAAAKDGPATKALRPALEREQAAYQSLLKLRAREHEVVMRQQRGAQRGGGSSRSQQQLDQLEMKDRENRYEDERTAAQQEDPAEREMRQVHSRLRELAQRQNDLNERLKELQAALQEAKTEEQRADIQQQLKRLQEEQERILRDTEELQARMDEPQNTERMAEAQQQLENARNNVRQSSDALREGQVPQAVTTGSRAQEDFEKLRDDFRKQTSTHFQQAVRELEKEATRVDEKEQEIAQDLTKLGETKDRPTSLRESGDRDKIATDLQNQQKDLDQLLNRMRQTIEEAEQPQPLLAEKLYDAARRAQQLDMSRGLTETRKLVEQGFDEQSRRQEEPVGRGLSELREGISRAADTVLDDEAETLRRAQRELRELAQQLQQEMRSQGQDDSPPTAAADSATGNESTPRTGEEPPGSQPGTGDPQQQKEGQRPGESPSSEGQNKRGERQKGQSQQGEPGQNQPGQNQPGQPQPGQPGQNQPEQGQPEQGQPGQGQPQPGQPGPGQNQPGQSQPGQSQPGQSQPGQPQPGSPGQGQKGQRTQGQPSQPGRGGPRDGGFERLSGFTGGDGNERLMEPISGEDFRLWSDRLRDVEELLTDPELSADAARIREQARSIRADARRHSAPPNWDLVKMQVAEPLVQLLDRVSQELMRRSGQDLLTPIDRDPVPPEYADEVRRYFERLGAGR